MARIYIVPFSQLQPGNLGKASRLEEDKELAGTAAKVDLLDAQIAAVSIERWRI